MPRGRARVRMPEGDTLYRTAQAPDRALAGQPVERFPFVVPARGAGRMSQGTPSARCHRFRSITSRIVGTSVSRSHGFWTNASQPASKARRRCSG